MANEIITVGARLKYAFENANAPGVRPTSGYVTLANVTDAPEVAMSLETIDVSNTQDKVSRYVPGRQDPGGEKQITMNHTDDGVELWNTLVALAETNKNSGLRLWWEYRYPNARNSFFFCGTPRKIGNSGFSGNSASTITGSVVFEEGGDWYPHSTEITPSATTASVVKNATTTITLTNSVGTIKITSSNPSAATATESSGTVTISGVGVGTSVLTIEDGNGDSCQVVVTVTAS